MNTIEINRCCNRNDIHTGDGVRRPINARSGVRTGSGRRLAGSLAAVLALVVLAGPCHAITTLGNNFTMIDSSGNIVGGTNDVVFSWDGTLYTDAAAQTTSNFSLASASSHPFFGFPWTAHDGRVFGPGSYSFPTTGGNTLDLEVGPGQVGAHVLFDWNTVSDVDVALLWNEDAAAAGDIFAGLAGDPPIDNVFGLATAQIPGDAFPGIAMVDGPFTGFRATFNVETVPLPASVWLLASGIAGLAGVARRRTGLA